MNIITLRNNIKEGLNIISGARKESSNIPILKNFLFETENGKLKLSSTNLEIGIVHKISSKIIEKGSAVIPFSMMNQIINNLSFERINIELNNEDNSILLKTDNYSAKISTASLDDFPVIPEIEEKENKMFKFSKEDLIDSFSSVIGSCNISDIKPELSGILFSYEIDSVKFAATDGFRLSEKKVSSKNIETDVNEEFSVIIPLKTVQEMIRIFSLIDENIINMSFDSNQVSFESENTYLVSRIIDGKFPNYKDIIPEDFSTEITINKEDLTTALKLSSSLSNKLNEIKFINEKGNKNIKIYSYNKELGESKYILQAKTKGDPVKITFNWKFILDGIKPITSKDVFIGFNGEDKPSLIKSSQDDSYLYVIMPIKSS